MLQGYEAWCILCSAQPVVLVVFSVVSLSLGLYRLLGFSYFPQTDAGQFVINIKAPSGTKLDGDGAGSSQGGGLDQRLCAC